MMQPISTILLSSAMLASTIVSAVSFPERTAELRREFSHLYDEQVIELADGSRKFHKGRHFVRDGIHVLHLRGQRFEMAFQHGALLKDIIRDGTIRQSSLIVRNSVRNAVGERPLLVNFITNYIHKNVTEKILDYSLQRRKGKVGPIDEGIGMSESTGISQDMVLKALLSPEVLMVVATDQSRYHASLAPMAGQCSTFVAQGSHTRDGEMLIGRNTDYPLNGFYDRHPTVIYFEPEDGGQKFMTVASAGIHNAGVLAINESGIYFSVHTIPTQHASTAGIPAFAKAAEVARFATSFDQAIELMRQNRPPAGWAYLVASFGEGKVASVELDNGKVAVRPAVGESHIQTNRYMTDAMAGRELFINESVDHDADARYQRIASLLGATRGSLDVREAISILSDHFDPLTQTVRGFPNTVSVHTTMTSLVVKPKSGRLYIGRGTAPVSENSFIEFPLVDRFNPDQFANEEYQEFEHVHHEHSAGPGMRAAQQKLIEAKMAYEYHNDSETAFAAMKEAARLEPDNAANHFVAGVTAMQVEDYGQAEVFLKASIEKSKTPHRRALGIYYLGRLYAELNRREPASDQFRQVLQIKDKESKLHQAAEHALERNRRIGRYKLDLRSLQLMLQQADMMHYY